MHKTLQNKLKKPLKFEVYWHRIGYVLVGAVVVLSLISPPDIPLWDTPWTDKLFHFLAYGFLMLWFAQLYTRTVFWIIATVFFSMGIGLEVAQTLTDDRFFGVMDMVANGVGVASGWAAACARFDSLLDIVEKRLLKSSL